MVPVSLTMAGAEISEGNQAGFVTERLEVRRLVMTDLTDFNEVWGDPRVIFWGATDDLDATRQRLQDFVSRRLAGIAEPCWYAVLRRDDGQFVGDVVLEPASWNEDVPEIGWHLRRSGRDAATPPKQPLDFFRSRTTKASRRSTRRFSGRTTRRKALPDALVWPWSGRWRTIPLAPTTSGPSTSATRGITDLQTEAVTLCPASGTARSAKRWGDRGRTGRGGDQPRG
jgi:hypothetical protein